MKTRKLLLLITLSVLISTLSFGQNYKSQFHIDKTGKIENETGTQLGTVDQDGTIKDSKGRVVGKVVKSGKETHLTDHLGKKMGELLADGSFKDDKGKVLYKLSTPDENGICKIIDKSGKEVGTVHENYKQQGACAYHCLSHKDHQHK
jgi:hypothetical protein